MYTVSFQRKCLMKLFYKSNNKFDEDAQLMFLKRLHRLIENGYPLIEALEVMKWDQNLIEKSEQLMESLKEGYLIDAAFEKAGFHPTIVAYLYFIRINGDVMVSLAKCIDMFEHRITYIKKFKNVIRYPIILFFIFIFLLIFLKRTILPSFNELFQSAGSDSTVFYSILFLDIVSTIFFIIVIGIAVCLLFWHFYKRTMPIERQIILYEKIPIYRTFLKMQTSYYFATHFSMFLKTGMPLKDVLTHISGQEKMPILSHYANLMMMQLQNGIYIDNLLPNLFFIEPQIAVIFQKNNNTAALEKDLSMFADFLAENLERKVLRIITLIQPVFFVMLACFIIFIYFTLMWPMFQLIQTV